MGVGSDVGGVGAGGTPTRGLVCRSGHARRTDRLIWWRRTVE